MFDSSQSSTAPTLLCMSIYSTELGPCWEPSMGPDMKA